ncbi:MAG: hypothetical protein IH987_09565 [Planctomycetes bacterium]|nr:hypothetical protein [Planctomycetota bacterium]
MSSPSAEPPNAQLVYRTLIVAGAIAAVVALTIIGIITYNYVTRAELRDPPPREHAAVPASPPSAILHV